MVHNLHNCYHYEILQSRQKVRDACKFQDHVYTTGSSFYLKFMNFCGFQIVECCPSLKIIKLALRPADCTLKTSLRMSQRMTCILYTGDITRKRKRNRASCKLTFLFIFLLHSDNKGKSIVFFTIYNPVLCDLFSLKSQTLLSRTKINARRA